MKLYLLLTIFVFLGQLNLLMVSSILPLKGVTSSAAKHLIVPNILPPQLFLSNSYYQKTCPDAEGIIQTSVMAWLQKDRTLAASIIRLHFHDCAVRGCDGSILLKYKESERSALASKTLRGFELINDIKAELERKCPRTVSCADILTAAARDATLVEGGPFWEVLFGRKDGRISIAREADMVPQGHENVTALIDFFMKRELTILDLVVLSGAHTIGRSSCYSILKRIGNPPDRTLDANYLKNLRRSCRQGSDLVYLDYTTPTNFDNEYFKNLGKKKGLLTTDQELLLDPRTSSFVSDFATQSELFINQFAVSMINLGNIIVPTSPTNTEIRLKCDFVNPSSYSSYKP